MATPSFHNLRYQYNKKKLTFDIHNVDLAFVNAFRRIILSEIPNVAVGYDVNSHDNKDVVIRKNTSALHNEFLSHRVSLIPLCFDETEIATFEPDKFIFKLNKKNTTANIMEVTSGDIEIYDEKNVKYDAAFHRKIFPVDDVTKDHILITKLKPNLYNLQDGEEVDMEFKALVGKAIEHSRWSPVCLCAYHNIIETNAADKAFLEKVKKTENDFGKELTEKQKNDMRTEFDTLDAYRHYHKNQFDEPNMFSFSIQTMCNLTPVSLFKQSIQVLIDKLTAFKDNLDNKEYTIITPHHSFHNFYELQIFHESHTLLNVLQSMIYNKNIRLSKTQHLEYIGYFQPHPLDNVMQLKLKFHKEVDASTDYIIQFLRENVDTIKEDLVVIQNQWLSIIL